MAQSREHILARYRDEIVSGMAGDLWVNAWASWNDELPREERTDVSGKDLFDVAPKTPKAAMDAAADLVKLYEGKEGDIVELYVLAQTADMEEDFDLGLHAGIDKWKLDDASLFGHMLAEMATGSGVSWFDDHKEFEIARVHFEVHFDGEDLVWSGGTQDVREMGRLGKITIVNPDNKEFTDHAFVLGFGAYSDTLLMAYADGLESALEECIAWIAENEEGMLVTQEQQAELVQELMEDEGLDEEEAQERVLEGLSSDGQNNWISNDEWHIVAEDPSEEDLQRIAGRKKNPTCTAADHARMKSEGWDELDKPIGGGTQKLRSGGVLELRNCPKCHSTIGRKVTGNPSGRYTRKGERMYQSIKRGYQKVGEQRAKEIAARTVSAAAKHGAKGLVRSKNPAGAVVTWKDGRTETFASAAAARKAIVERYHNAVDIGFADDKPGHETIDIYDEARGTWINAAGVIVSSATANPPERLAAARQSRLRAEAALAARKKAGFKPACDDPNCKGWDVFETDRGIGIERCDVCAEAAKKRGLPELFDSDAKHLPEARRAFERAFRGED